MRYYYHYFPRLLLGHHHITFTLSTLSPWHAEVALGWNSPWSQPGKTAFLCCAGNRKNIMSSAVTFANICCAATSLALLGEKAGSKAVVICFPDWLGCIQTGLFACESRCICGKQNFTFLWLSFFWGPDWGSTKIVWKLQILNRSPSSGVLLSQCQGCNCSVCKLGRQSSVYPTVVSSLNSQKWSHALKLLSSPCLRVTRT